MRYIPYELIEKIFGTYIANNFNEISGALMLVGIVLTLFKREKARKAPKESPRQKHSQKTRRKYSKWYPSGWVFNEETQLWEPPDYLSKESKNRWKWDENKRIWIDKEKEK